MNLDVIPVINDNDSPHEDTRFTRGMDVNSDQHRGLGTDGVTVDSQIQEISENECTDQSDITCGNDKVKLNDFKRQFVNYFKRQCVNANASMTLNANA